MSITENKERIGCFTSSNIHKLMKRGRGKDEPFSKPALTYIQEKQIEVRMGRSIEVSGYSRAAAWGTFLEMFVFEKLGLAYEITSNKTDVHPTIPHWSGSKDLIVRGVKVSDLKCYQPKKFALYTDALLSKDVQRIKEEFPEEYWQLGSNAIINQVPNVEAITYMPYESELDDLRDFAANYEGSDQWKYRFIYEAPKHELAYLPDGGYYKDLNKFEFEFPKEDRELLESRVLEAIELLTK